MKGVFVVFLGALFAISSCNPQGGEFAPFGNPDNEVEGQWLIPANEIFDGGPGKDGIPSIDNPKFISASEVDFLSDSDLVIAVSYHDIVKVYPHPILDWHEILNDRIDDFSFALTYCPLTGTAINWNRIIDNKETTFGVSGLLYNSNLIPYDRETGSNWSQIRLDCVNGENSGLGVETIPVFEGTWGQVKTMEEIQVLSTDTGVDRNYSNYPYGDYRTNHSKLLFPVSNSDSRKSAKERVLGVIENGMPKAFAFSNFTSDTDEVIIDSYEGKDILVAGNRDHNYIVAFYPVQGRTYEPVMNDFPYIIQDSEGNIYDVFGRTKSSSKENLQQPEQFIGYWFSWAAFYPDLEVYEN